MFRFLLGLSSGSTYISDLVQNISWYFVCHVEKLRSKL
jgi:hypothetical protein